MAAMPLAPKGFFGYKAFLLSALYSPAACNGPRPYFLLQRPIPRDSELTLEMNLFVETFL